MQCSGLQGAGEGVFDGGDEGVGEATEAAEVVQVQGPDKGPTQALRHRIGRLGKGEGPRGRRGRG